MGLEIPIRGKTKLANKPVNVIKARLSPTEYSKLSIAPILWILRILRTRIPGIKVRKIKPTICLRTGVSKPKPASPTRPSTPSKTPSEKYRHFLISQSLGSVITVYPHLRSNLSRFLDLLCVHMTFHNLLPLYPKFLFSC